MSKAEKFIQLNTKKYSNETRITIGRNSHWEKQPWLTPEQTLAAVEIARKELIEKFCEWLQGFMECSNLFEYEVSESEQKKVINDFKQAMKEQL